MVSLEPIAHDGFVHLAPHGLTLRLGWISPIALQNAQIEENVTATWGFVAVTRASMGLLVTEASAPELLLTVPAAAMESA